MTIPEIRERLFALARYLEQHNMPVTANEVRGLAAELRRRPQHGNGRRVSRRMTDELRLEIISLHHAHPRLTQHEIAQRVGVNAGRVSETLHGFRT